jgi:hypothetical protein
MKSYVGNTINLSWHKILLTGVICNEITKVLSLSQHPMATVVVVVVVVVSDDPLINLYRRVDAGSPFLPQRLHR